jgi:hypothetical protein
LEKHARNEKNEERMEEEWIKNGNGGEMEESEEKDE